MRNIFDQYSQPENRLTHALATVLHQEPKLLAKFLRKLVKIEAPAARQLTVLEQRLPGEAEPNDENERQGLPDMWIHDREENWALLIECKISAGLTTNQLRRHIRTAERRGFGEINLLVIAPATPKTKLPPRTKVVLWKEIYHWACQQGADYWAKNLRSYMEIAERKMSDDGYLKEHTLTTFSGIPFGDDEPYHYREAKRVLRLLMEELKQRPGLRSLGVQPKAKGRTAITGRATTGVWDFLPLKTSSSKAGSPFTSAPHLTMNIQQSRISAQVTVPNGIQGSLRRSLIGLELDGFTDLLVQCGRNLRRVAKKSKGAFPNAYLLQRHFRSQRSHPVRDALISIDLRTAMAKRGKPMDDVKAQPEWLEALYTLYANRHSNMQLGIGVEFPFSDSTRAVEVVDLLEETWLGCKPLLDVLR
jgi:PD-(D/E)XK nuclease superfamily protein